MSVMRRLLVMSGIVMLCRFSVMPSSMRMVFRRLLMMFRSFLRHLVSSELDFALLGAPEIHRYV
jgi:hypothetical protein